MSVHNKLKLIRRPLCFKCSNNYWNAGQTNGMDDTK